MTEQWRPIDGYAGIYEISDFGRVRSVLRGIIMKLERNVDGYSRIMLQRGGVQERFFVHRLVLTAFRGPCPTGQQAAHNNGCRTDNRICNLRWDTLKNNHADKWRHGTQQAGEQHPNRKLNNDLVRLIRRDARSSIALGSVIGIDPSTIRKVRRGVAWSSVK